MKNNYILILLLLSSITGFACSYSTLPLNQKFMRSDFVANVTVTKIHTNENNDRYYKADIEISDLFKGKKLTSIYVDGNNGRDFVTSCDIFFKEGDKLIVYAGKISEGKYGIMMWSGYLHLNRPEITDNTQKYHQKEINVLRALKSKKVDFVNANKFAIKFSMTKDLGTFLRGQRGIKLNKDFAIYEVTFKENLKVKCVRKLIGFDHKIDRKIKKFLRKSEWSGGNNKEDGVNKVSNTSKHIVIIHYNEHEDVGYMYERF